MPRHDLNSWRVVKCFDIKLLGNNVWIGRQRKLQEGNLWYAIVFVQKWCLSWVLENKLRISSNMSFGYNCIILIATCEPTRILLRKDSQVSHSFQAMQNSLYHNGIGCDSWLDYCIITWEIFLNTCINWEKGSSRS
jgi:hypothetical protein